MTMLRGPLPENPFLRQMAGSRIPTTAGQVLRAQAGMETTFELLERQVEIDVAEGVAERNITKGPFLPLAERLLTERQEPDRLPPEELNEQFGHLGLKFDRPMTLQAARVIAEGKRAEIVRQNIVERGPGGVTGIGAALAGGLIATAIDPLEVASSFVPIVGQARVAALTARLGRVGGRAAAGVTEGAVGNLMLEPGFGLLSRQQQLDYGMADALFNVGLGGLIGGLGGIGRGLADRRRVPMPEEPPFGLDPNIEQARIEMPDAVRQMRNEKRIEAHRAALAQAAQGKAIDVSPYVRPRGEADAVVRHAPGGANRPQRLTEFLAQNGGINDADPTFRGEIAARGNPNIPFAGKVAKPNSRMNLDDAAELAAEEGFISRRDTNELLDALDRDMRGQPVVRDQEVSAQMDVEAASRVAVDAEMALDRFDRAHRELRAVGINDATPDEIERVASIMERDRVGADDAFERMAIEDEGRVSAEVAEREADPRRDFSADFDAAERIERELQEAFDVEGDTEELVAIIDQMRQNGTLPRDADAEIGKTDDLASQAKAYADTARAAAACLAG